MIKLLDILKESNLPQHSTDHWRDHFNKISELATEALTSNDPETIASIVHEIIEHADAARDKHEATWSKARTPEYVNSNISNSYSGDDSDINAYQDQPI
mgnify:CR=1 FL=1